MFGSFKYIRQMVSEILPSEFGWKKIGFYWAPFITRHFCLHSPEDMPGLLDDSAVQSFHVSRPLGWQCLLAAQIAAEGAAVSVPNHQVSSCLWSRICRSPSGQVSAGRGDHQQCQIHTCSSHLGADSGRQEMRVPSAADLFLAVSSRSKTPSVWQPLTGLLSSFSCHQHVPGSKLFPEPKDNLWF